MTTDTTPSRVDFWPRPLHAVALVLPLLLLAAGAALDRTAGGGRSIENYLDLVAAAPDAYLVGGMLMVAGMAGLIATAAALVRLSGGVRRPAILRVGAIAIGLWGVCGAVGVSLGFTAGWVGTAVHGAVDAEVLRVVFEGITYSPWGMIGGGLGGLAYVIGVLATGIGLIVARGVPTWTGILLLAGPVATFTSGPLGIPLLMSAGFVLAAVGLAGTIPMLLRAPRLMTSAPAREHERPVSVD